MSAFFSSEKIDWLWRGLIIQFFIFILYTLSFVYFSLPLSIQIKPYFLLMPIFFWAIKRPTIISPFLLFIYGLGQDIIYDYPLGLHSILYLFVFYFIRKQRLYLMSQTYPILLMFFSVLCVFFGLFEWLFFSIKYFKILDVNGVLFSSIITIFIYPFINWIFTLLNLLLKPMSNIENY